MILTSRGKHRTDDDPCGFQFVNPFSSLDADKSNLLYHVVRVKEVEKSNATWASEAHQIPLGRDDRPSQGRKGTD